MEIEVIILAAGKGSRMGAIKQLLPYKESTLLQYIIKQALSSRANHVSCVIGANSEIIKKTLSKENITVIYNPEWELGLSSSIVAAISFIKTLKRLPRGVLFLLADQPNVDSNYIDELITYFKKNTKKVISSAYENTNGVPALFPYTYFDKLINLKGDKGAKLLLNNTEEFVLSFKSKDKDGLFDVDTPEDYNKLINKMAE